MGIKTFLVLASAGLAAATPLKQVNATALACQQLSKTFPDSTFFPGSERYDFENTYSWSAASWLNPACVFTPSAQDMVSFALRTVVSTGAKFAIRGGGAMPIDNASNIGPEGILLANTNMTTMQISEDLQTVTVGAGIKWPELYAYLDESNVTANGIRMGDAGVIGYILGGGIGFFSYEHGMATAVQSFECVLANGQVAVASETENPDLFWALKGGGNNFCYVTQAVLNTLPYNEVQLAAVSYGTDAAVGERYIQGLAEFANYAGSDPKASMEGQIRWVPSRNNGSLSYDAFLFYNSPTINSTAEPPAGLQNFSAPVLAPISGSLQTTTMGKWANSFPYTTLGGYQKIFHFFSIPADPKAFTICLDTYYETIYGLEHIANFSTAFSIMPITDHVMSTSPPNAVGLDGESAPALWLVESPTWANADDNEEVLAAHAQANTNINANLAAAGYEKLPFIYLSDAQKVQVPDVFPSYGQENVQKLQDIRDRYDPSRVFTDLQPGGAKVAHVTDSDFE